MSALPNYKQIDETLLADEPSISAAETHGLLCGYLCGDVAENGQQWEKVLASTVAINNITQHIFTAIDKQFAENDFALQLLLPDDDAPLAIRALALTEWCGGFLVGLGLTGINLDHVENEELDEVINDLIAISQAEYDETYDRQDSEENYQEILEYARMAALFIFTELRSEEQRNIFAEESVKIH